MPEHPNVQRVRESLETFNRGDLQAYREFFDEDVVWYVRGRHPMAGTYRGRDALFEYFERARGATDGSLTVTPVDVVANDDYAGVVAQVTGRRQDGRTLDVRITQAFSLGGSGRFSEYWALAGDQQSVDEFWAEEAQP